MLQGFDVGWLKFNRPFTPNANKIKPLCVGQFSPLDANASGRLYCHEIAVSGMGREGPDLSERNSKNALTCSVSSVANNYHNNIVMAVEDICTNFSPETPWLIIRMYALKTESLHITAAVPSCTLRYGIFRLRNDRNTIIINEMLPWETDWALFCLCSVRVCYSGFQPQC